MNPRINYTHNWNNKLLNIAHTTIRVRNDQKYKVGMIIEEWYNEEFLGIAKIEVIQHFRMSQLTETMALLDTGYGKEAAETMFRNMYKARGFDWDVQQFSFITLRCPDTRIHYIVPTQLKRTDKAANLFPEPRLFHHQAESDIKQLVTI